ncbi:hypothetical protein [Paludisphaera borealis]|uniref:hypothetical protein n=1 Tax=Paludisphaera borealis TaxID=1387353 RepID=UPI000970984E|nr:hypothetical protein [Paludisphaera borealis]
MLVLKFLNAIRSRKRRDFTYPVRSTVSSEWRLQPAIATRTGSTAVIFGDWILIDCGGIGDGFREWIVESTRGNSSAGGPAPPVHAASGGRGLLVEKAETATRCGFTVLVLEGLREDRPGWVVGRLNPRSKERPERGPSAMRRGASFRALVWPVSEKRPPRSSDPFGGSMGIGGPDAKA